MELLFDIIDIAVYSALGIFLMMLGSFLIDLIIPCHFPTEIKKGNTAVGWLSAGSFIGIGIILRAAIMSPAAETVQETLASGLISSALYFVIGILFFIIGYLIVNAMNKQYNLSEEIGKGNQAAGIMVFGVFVGLSFVISGVIF